MLTILLVDDNRHLQIAFKKVLSSSGYRVELASDGEEGLRLAHSTRPDVILLDMLLPKLGGVEVLRALKADFMTKTIPVIALSGLPMSNESRVRRDGAVSYLQKSNLENFDLLLQSIDHALLLPRDNEFSEVAFLPNTPEQAEVCQPSPSNDVPAESSASKKDNE
jgi:CheY-like chemotaxis protein